MLEKTPIRIEQIAAGALLTCFIASGLCALTGSSAADNAAATTLINRTRRLLLSRSRRLDRHEPPL
jgi:hypothetical protein